MQCFFKEHIRFLVDNGARTKFWEVRWLCKETLQVKFLALYEVSGKKNCMINQVISQSLNGVEWNLEPKSILSEHEIAEYLVLCDMLCTV